MLEHRSRRAAGDDLAAADKRHLVGHPAGKAHLVGHEHEPGADLFELADHLEDLGGHLRIEGGGWFVEKQPLRLAGESPEDGDPLLLPAGELGRALVGMLRELEALERLSDPLARRRGGEAMDMNQRQSEVVERREMGEEVVGLEDGPHFAPVGEEPGFIARHRHPGEAHAPLFCEIEPGEDPQERGLAAAGGADEDQRPDVARGEIEPVENGRCPVRLRETLDDKLHQPAS